MADLSIKFKGDGFQKYLKRRPQAYRSVLRNTINTTLFTLKSKDWPREAKQQIDFPTRFTTQGTLFSKATTKNLTGTFFIKDTLPTNKKSGSVAQYLRRLIYQRATPEIVPISKSKRYGTKINRFGNIVGLRGGRFKGTVLGRNRKNQRKVTTRAGIGKRGTVFEGEINGQPGIWRSFPNGGLVALYVYKTSVRPSRRLDFIGAMRSWAKIRIAKAYPVAIRRELAKANK